MFEDKLCYYSKSKDAPPKVLTSSSTTLPTIMISRTSLTSERFSPTYIQNLSLTKTRLTTPLNMLFKAARSL